MRCRPALPRSLRMMMAAVTAVVSTGCASMLGGYSTAPNGLATDEDRLRQLLSTGRAAAAVEQFEDRAPEDMVLRALYQGVLAYHAGDYAGSAAILDAAGTMADDRVTKSVSRSALSVVSSDLVLPYEPGRTERLMVPYYAALARTQLGDRSGAAVEARRLSLLLQQYRDQDAAPDPRFAATLHMVAAAMFEANGDRADADVAFRNAVALDSTLVPMQRSAAAGSVFVILEQGFVAHRVEQGLAVMLLPEEVHALAHGESDDRAAASAYVAGRVLERAAYMAGLSDDRRGSTLYVPAPDHTDLPRRRVRTVCTATESEPADSSSPRESRRVCSEREEEIDELPYLLKVAWPVYRSEFRMRATPSIIGAGDTVSFATYADLSTSVRADFEAERPLIVARTLARGAAKLALTKSAEQTIEEQNAVAGRLVGLLGNIGSALLERADTRSWHLLPGGVAVARLTLPAGEHELTVDVDGRMVPVNARVEAGRMTVLPVRVWQ